MAKKKKKRTRKSPQPVKRASKKRRGRRNDRWWLPMLLGAATLVALFVGGPALLNYLFPKDKPRVTHRAGRKPRPPAKTPRPAPSTRATSGVLARLPSQPAESLFSNPDLTKGYEQAIADLKAGKPPMPIRRRLERLIPEASGDAGRMHLLVATAYAALQTRDGKTAARYLETLEQDFPENPYGTYAKVMALDAEIMQQARGAAQGSADVQKTRDILNKALALADSALEEDTQAYALFVAGKAYATLGQTDKAAETYLEVASRYPDGAEAPQALLRAADMQRQQKQIDRAIETLERLIARYPSAKATKQARKTLKELRLIGKPAPELKVEAWVNGDPSPLSSLRGKVVLLAFWQTWCPHCREELPQLAELYEAYRDRGLVVVGATKNDRRQDEATLKAFLEAHPLPFPVARVNPLSSSDYAVSGIPAGVLIDKHGIIRERAHPSRITRDMIDELLAED